MLNYVPKKISKKKMEKNKESVNCNLFVPDAYPIDIRLRVSMIDEDSQHLEIIQVRCISIFCLFIKKCIIIIITIVVFTNLH